MAWPNVKMLEIAGGALTNEGFETVGFGAEYWKEAEIFSSAHDILQSLLWGGDAFDYTHDVEITQDHDASTYPEVYQAWQGAGGEEGLMNVAKLATLGKWGVGFGGKKNGERAAKLALAMSVASDSPNLKKVCKHYPDFKYLIASGGGGGDDGFGDDYESYDSYEGKGGKSGGGKGGKSAGKGGKEEALMQLLSGKAGGKGGKQEVLMGLVSMLKGGGDDGGWGDDGWGDDGWGDDGWGAGKSGGGWGKSAGGKGGGGKSGGGKKGGGPYGDGGKGGKGKGGGKGGAKGKLNAYPAEQKVWVGSLPTSTTEQSLQDHFGISGGTVAAAVIMKSGTGCVVYSSEEEAQQAIALLNGTELDGQAIEVDVWTKK